MTPSAGAASLGTLVQLTRQEPRGRQEENGREPGRNLKGTRWFQTRLIGPRGLPHPS